MGANSLQRHCSLSVQPKAHSHSAWLAAVQRSRHRILARQPRLMAGSAAHTQSSGSAARGCVAEGDAVMLTLIAVRHKFARGFADDVACSAAAQGAPAALRCESQQQRVQLRECAARLADSAAVFTLHIEGCGAPESALLAQCIDATWLTAAVSLTLEAKGAELRLLQDQIVLSTASTAHERLGSIRASKL